MLVYKCKQNESNNWETTSRYGQITYSHGLEKPLKEALSDLANECTTEEFVLPFVIVIIPKGDHNKRFRIKEPDYAICSKDNVLEISEIRNNNLEEITCQKEEASVNEVK